jgi:uncharacterized protein
MVNYYLLIVLLLVEAFSVGHESQAKETSPCSKESILITINDLHIACVEIAQDDSTRSFGLMQRRHIPENTGMLFVFPTPDYYGMWMKNTPIPLSVAFIDDSNRIISIDEMLPHTLDYHFPVVPVRYVLEMPMNWFAARGIQAGQLVKGIAQIQNHTQK